MAQGILSGLWNVLRRGMYGDEALVEAVAIAGRQFLERYQDKSPSNYVVEIEVCVKNMAREPVWVYRAELFGWGYGVLTVTPSDTTRLLETVKMPMPDALGYEEHFRIFEHGLPAGDEAVIPPAGTLKTTLRFHFEHSSFAHLSVARVNPEFLIKPSTPKITLLLSRVRGRRVAHLTTTTIHAATLPQRTVTKERR